MKNIDISRNMVEAAIALVLQLLTIVNKSKI